MGQNRAVPSRPLLIAAGGVLGVLMRWSVLNVVPDHATHAVVGLNIVGSLLIGFLAGQGHERSDTWPFAAVGFCGGLTTFSTFAADVANRLDGGHAISGLGLFTLTSVAAVVSAGIGYRVGSPHPDPDPGPGPVAEPPAGATP